MLVVFSSKVLLGLTVDALDLSENVKKHYESHVNEAEDHYGVRRHLESGSILRKEVKLIASVLYGTLFATEA